MMESTQTAAEAQTPTDTNMITSMGTIHDAIARILQEFPEGDTSTFITFHDTNGDMTTYTERSGYDDTAILLAGRVEYPRSTPDGTAFDERVILETPFAAKEIMNDAWDVAYAKYNGDHWHIEAEHTAEFIAFAISRGFDVVTRPALLADVGRFHCPAACCGESFDTFASLRGHLGGMASSGDEAHLDAKQRRNSAWSQQFCHRRTPT